MNKRGQVGIELLLIALLVLMGSIGILSYYTTVNDSTTAMQLLKAKLLEKTAELDEFVYIEKIEFLGIEGLTITFRVFTEPNVSCEDLELVSAEIEGRVKKLILDTTEFKTVKIYLNNAAVSC